jgi:hypothetical protein
MADQRGMSAMHLGRTAPYLDQIDEGQNAR